MPAGTGRARTMGAAQQAKMVACSMASMLCWRTRIRTRRAESESVTRRAFSMAWARHVRLMCLPVCNFTTPLPMRSGDATGKSIEHRRLSLRSFGRGARLDHATSDARRRVGRAVDGSLPTRAHKRALHARGASSTQRVDGRSLCMRSTTGPRSAQGQTSEIQGDRSSAAGRPFHVAWIGNCREYGFCRFALSFANAMRRSRDGVGQVAKGNGAYSRGLQRGISVAREAPRSAVRYPCVPFEIFPKMAIDIQRELYAFMAGPYLNLLWIGTLLDPQRYRCVPKAVHAKLRF